MYLVIIVLPILGSIVSGFFGRKVGVSGAQLITCLSVIITTFMATIGFLEVGLNNIPVSVLLFRWLDSESLNVLWGFNFDSLTVSMLIPVLIVSSLVHIYSIGYMSHDPHNQRFFSYLSLFTFMMIVLVTANNFLLMFVGWEGSHIICPKWLSAPDTDNCVLLSSMSFNLLRLLVKHGMSIHTLCNQKRFFFSNKLKSKERIGPHNLDVISLIVGSLLTNTYLEKRKNGLAIRITFVKCSNNVEFLMGFHLFLSKRGYCNYKEPKLSRIITKGNKVLFLYSINSYSFSSLVWLFDMFYRNNIKIIPSNLDKYLTPLALATWFLSDVGLHKKAKTPTIFHVSIEDLKYLSFILKNKYYIDTVTDSKTGSLYIKYSSLSTFSKIVKPHILPSLYYKLKGPVVKLSLHGTSGLHISSTLHPSLKLAEYSIKRYFSTNKDLSNVKYTIKYKTEFVLSLEQKEALTGIILGDGFLERQKPNHNTRLRVEQSYPEKVGYLNSLFKLLQPLTAMIPVLLTRKDKRSGSVTQSLYFRTLAMPCLNCYYELFYKEKKKIIPKNLGELLTARGLAFWIMDDGGKSVYNQTILHTRAFTKEEVIHIQHVLLENFGLITRLEEKKKGQWVIYIPVKQKTKLKDIVGLYMYESMLYKI